MITFFLGTSPVSAKKYPYFNHLGVEDGLAQNTVYCILQDNRGFMWFGTKDGLSRYDGYEFRNYRNDKNDPQSIGNNCIRSLFQDFNGEIWVGTDAGAYIYHPDKDCFEYLDAMTKDSIKIQKEVNDIKQDQNGVYWFAVDWQGVFSYNPVNKELVFYELNAIVNAWCIYIDKENKVWIGTHGGGLNYFNAEKQQFEKVNYLFDNQVGDNEDDIYRIFQDDYNDLLITTANSGVKRLNLVTNKIQPFLPLQSYSSLFVRDVIRKSDNEIWFATGGGICVYDVLKKEVEFLQHNRSNPYTISDNATYSIYKDREGGIWVGTYFGGINYYPYQYTPFNKYYPVENRNEASTLIGKRIREFQATNDGRVWIGTEDGGLSLFDPQSDTFEHYLANGKPGNVSYNNIHGLLIDDNQLWIGTYNHGLDIMDLITQKVVKHYAKTDKENSICDNSIFSIYKDHSGRVWIGTLYGLCYYNAESDNFTRVSSLGNIFVSDILQTKDGMVWVGALGGGLYRFNPNDNKWTVFKNDPKNPASLSHNKIISLFEDSKMTLWITTEGGGLCKYNPKEENFASFTTNEGLPNNVVYKVVEDNHSNLWFTTNQGIVCMNMNDYSIKQYTKSDGLLSNQFNYKSGVKDINGHIYFGGLEGFVSFDPASFVSNSHAPSVYIVQFELFNTIVKPGEKNSPLKKAIESTEKIELKYNQSTFSFSFAALSYVAPEKNRYAYMLEGFDEDWIYLEKAQKVGYSNVPPGKYTMKVKASNNNGVWSDKITSIEIDILPPFYKTVWAYIIYFIIIVSIIALLTVSYRNKIRKKNKRRQEVFENEKSREIYDAKIAFFTNITHEIRTPLSLIKGPLEYIIKEKVSNTERSEYLKVIERNTNRLLDLSNQLLDFRKTEQKGFRLNFTSTDISLLINEIYMRFNASAIRRNIKFEIDLPSESFQADVDKEAFTKILSNLFNNAVKYAKSEIYLTVKKDTDSFHIIIRNDGNKIKGHLQDKIFEPFYQQIEEGDTKHIPTGTGLGLPLARSLAELHDGSLRYIHSDDQFNYFQLTLPIVQSIRVNLEHNIGKPVQEELLILNDEPTNLSKYSLLIVEDDEDLRLFLCNQLKGHYNIFKATNGAEALEILNAQHINAIITDIAMPVMDGLQLCKEIKSNIDYSHIPIILLTARTTLQSKIEGLDAGADAYVEKPFSMEHMLAQLSNLLSNRNKLKEAFIHSPLVKIKSIAPTKADETFLKEVTEVIHKNISDTQFNVDALASALNMSRSSLHRKIKGISELTPNDFILLVKLKKAAEYIKEGYRVSEVCFIVGFNSPSYFSKVFKKQFGVSPTEWMQ
ncbi:ligand-binding sensor domain-containing protein/signal transduction histidine kinase/DNA-binding response OmpR family regulator [Dysgonomonas hofstadii]|uniref:histidine kinase n=1 Tax=Dysgonomonas hofstadii TaxID=637886 RepID=A0A840CLF6_9BACT|nr:hybrid sensor histidine kinase/response regulator transcription factor [Dysgonomonas hofstadii]MBB4034264.1 ligand-binding sensor domain-containing protein/signal transduction histidine kinase/DNA-binding response OmpR family regulator [Dysgonomonas hofstadii]